MRMTRILIVIVIMGVGSCKTRETESRTKNDSAAIKGFILPGKGFNIASNDVMGATCVTSDKLSDSPDPSASSSNSSSELPSSKPAEPVSSQPVSPTQPKIDAEKGGLKLSENGEAVDLGDIDLEFANGRSASGSSNMALNDQSGGTSVQFYYLTSTKDVSAAIEASYSNNSSASAKQEELSGNIAQNFDAQLNVKYKNSSENVYVLMHGRKEYPARSSDAIINPYFNNRHRNVVFDGKTLPPESTLPNSWRRMVQTCGDHYVEYTIKGREIWMVAVMNKKTFETAMGGSVNYGAKASGSFGDIASASKEIKAGVKGDSSSKLLQQTVDVLMQSRGKNQVEGGKFTLSESLEQMNKFLTTEGVEGEAILRVGLRSYDSVTFTFDKDMEKRGGDIFTRSVRDAAGLNTDIFVKLQSEENWANKQADLIWNRYGWEQWSLDPRHHNGIAAQYKTLKAYSKNISDVFKYCGSRNLDVNTVASDCINQAKTTAASTRPQLNLPEPYSHKISLWMSPETISASETKTFDYKSKGATYQTAKSTCQMSQGWTIPGQEDWKRVLDASYFYTKWQKDQDPGYKADEDKAYLGFPCGRFGQGAIFWSDSDSSVVKMNHNCESSQIQDLDIPSSQKYTRYIFWTEKKAFYGCVFYQSN